MCRGPVFLGEMETGRGEKASGSRLSPRSPAPASDISFQSRSTWLRRAAGEEGAWLCLLPASLGEAGPGGVAGVYAACPGDSVQA